jgi:ATP-dependent RNA helicase RhlE
MNEHTTFAGLSLAPNILAVLEAASFTTPTPIQAQAIPHGLEGKDVIGVAQTGTGKTLAFGLPIIQKFTQQERGFGLILVPTRELALQVEETIVKVGRPLGIVSTVLIGGTSMRPQIKAVHQRPHIIIATPGRLIDHLEQGTFTLEKAKMVVFDEADRMLDMGFWPQIQRIVQSLPHERQTMLFSATLSKEIVDLARKHMKTPVSIEVAPQGTTAEKVTQEFFIVNRADKTALLASVLEKHTGSTIVFTRTKHGARKLAHTVQRMGHTAAEIHGDRSLGQRKEALSGFKNGKYRVLVATDIAARGIDVKGIALVVNYDMPMQTADYVHRIGRTARAGADGHAITFAQPDERRDMRDIERLIRQPLTVSPLPEGMPATPQYTSSHDSSGGGRSYGNARGSSFSRGGRSQSSRGFSQRSGGYRSRSEGGGYGHGRSSSRPRFQSALSPRRDGHRDRAGD